MTDKTASDNERMTLAGIKQWLRAHKIVAVECLAADLTGYGRGKFVSADKFGREDTRLPEALLMQSVTGTYPDEFDDILGLNDGDMLLRPDLDTVRLVPWAKQPTAQIIHDCISDDGQLHPLSSRAVLQKVLALYASEGLQPVVAPEVEFYLVAQSSNPHDDLQAPTGRTRRKEVMRCSYTTDAISEFAPLVGDMFSYCKAMALDVDGLIDETGSAQMEINFRHGSALNLADQVFSFKRLLRETALQHDVFATFMAKPIEGQPGSSMHIHQSIVDVATGKNIFVDADGVENPRLRYFIGGMQTHTNAAMAFYAPNVNSYRRFVREFAAPINLNWGDDNRTVGIRVPQSSPQASRIENRYAGVDCNPYLALAASLACGYLGMREQLQPSEPCQNSSYDGEVGVPRTLADALRLLDDSRALREILGDSFVDAYVAVKTIENDEFNRVISVWEREHLLLNV